MKYLASPYSTIPSQTDPVIGNARPQCYIAQCVCFFSGYIFQITVAWVHEEIESVAGINSHAIQLSTLIPLRECQIFCIHSNASFVSRYTTVIMCCSHRTTNCLPWSTVRSSQQTSHEYSTDS